MYIEQMKKLFILSLLLISITTGIAQNTIYYEREAIVVNNKKKSSRGDGHFITFTETHCYDSDIEGISEDTGTLKYIETNSSGIRIYCGKSFFGETEYCFANDLSRINIYANDTIYVYVRKTPPNGVRKSSRPPKKKQVTTIILPPVKNDVPGKIVPERKEKKKPESRYGWYDCPTCIDGRCSICGGDKIRGNEYLGGEDMICNVCDRYGNCSACQGKGKKYGIVK